MLSKSCRKLKIYFVICGIKAYIFKIAYKRCFICMIRCILFRNNQKQREEEGRLTTRMNLRNNERSTRFTLSSADLLERCRCSTAGEIERLRALQNDLHYNRLCIRERRSMRSKRHYLCMRRNYNNCTIMYVCALRIDVAKRARMCKMHTRTHTYTHIHAHTRIRVP